jgi:hypothetical protein
VLSGRGLCDELIARPEESYRLWCVVVCDLETSRIGAPYIYDISSLRIKGPRNLLCRFLVCLLVSSIYLMWWPLSLAAMYVLVVFSL